MLLMLFLVLCTGLNLIVIPNVLVVLLSCIWLLLDSMLVTGIYTRLASYQGTLEP